MSILEELAQNIIEGQNERVEELTRQALDEGISVVRVLNGGLIDGMNVVGERFKQADMFIPEVLLAAKAMQAGMDILMPLLHGAEYRAMGRVVLGTVKGDIHDIGKNLVNIMLSGAGFEVIDLGVNVLPEKFIEAAVDEKAQLIGMSSLLTVTMPAIKDTIEELRKAGLQDKIKTIIGGATVTQRYADEVGADGYAKDAPSAVAKVKELLVID